MCLALLIMRPSLKYCVEIEFVYLMFGAWYKELFGLLNRSISLICAISLNPSKNVNKGNFYLLFKMVFQLK